MSLLRFSEFEAKDLLVERLRSRKISKVEFDADETEVGCRHRELGSKPNEKEISHGTVSWQAR
jgi:hypothetical protein